MSNGEERLAELTAFFEGDDNALTLPADDRGAMEGLRRLLERSGAGDRAAVRAEIDGLIAATPGDASLHLLSAAEHLRADDKAGACLEIAVALAVDPGHTAAHRMLGRFLRGLGRREEANAVLEAGWRVISRDWKLRNSISREHYFTEAAAGQCAERTTTDA